MNQHVMPNTAEIEAALELTDAARTKAKLRRLMWLVPLLALVAGGIYYWQASSAAEQIITYDTIDAKPMDVTITVAATGALQPITKVDVGTETSGVVREVLVDDNDVVKQGAVLAKLDVSKLALQRARVAAQAQSVEARLLAAEADLAEAERQMWRQIDLYNRGTGTEESRDAAVAAKARVLPVVAAARSDLAAAKAEINVMDADLVRADILSPIDGMILKRSVEPGQTVAASLQAPVLFTIAQDLSLMQLEANVDEADVGLVQPGQKASFAVDAYRGKSFPAVIQRMSFQPETVDGVVTYKTILSAPNPELALRPGMTATARIVVAEHKDVLAVSNEAFRFQPPRVAEKKGFSVTELFMPRFPRGERPRKSADADGMRKLYVLRADKAVEVKVKTGATDGKVTIVTEGELKPDDKVIIARKSAR
jgi:HlyD family secretion protein